MKNVRTIIPFLCFAFVILLPTPNKAEERRKLRLLLVDPSDQNEEENSPEESETPEEQEHQEPKTRLAEANKAEPGVTQIIINRGRGGEESDHAKATNAVGSVVKDEAELNDEETKRNDNINLEVALEDQSVAQAEKDNLVESLEKKADKEEKEAKEEGTMKAEESMRHSEAEGTINADEEAAKERIEAAETDVEAAEHQSEGVIHHEISELKDDERVYDNEAKNLINHRKEANKELTEEKEKLKKLAKHAEESNTEKEALEEPLIPPCEIDTDEQPSFLKKQNRTKKRSPKLSKRLAFSKQLAKNKFRNHQVLATK